MKKAILLFTDWEKGYWESSKEAPYTRRKYTDMHEWNHLKSELPLPGLGIYGNFKKQDLSREPFVYLRIDGMRYDDDSKQPYFSFTPIKPTKIESIQLTRNLPPELQKLFVAIDVNTLMTILNEIGETPPSEWMNLIELREVLVSWRDYIGKYFLEIETESLSNDEFEDRIYALLTALGFNVTQKGHTLQGEYCDGIFSFEDYAVVYDCKNSPNFVPSADDTRAIEKYLSDEKKVRREKNIYSAFIAKSFGGQHKGDIFHFNTGPLIYLLYKKLLMGSKFALDPIKKVLENRTPLTDKNIDNEWRI
jgi:hypothetical protein